MIRARQSSIAIGSVN